MSTGKQATSSKRSNVSIALASYNGERFIRDQIDSILCQLIPGDELVISIDPSSDATSEIVDLYAASYPFIKVFDGPGKGVNANFEYALSQCSNDIVLISDQDDKWAPNKVDVMVKALNESNADLAVHDGIHFNDITGEESTRFFQLYGYNKGFIGDFIKSRYSGCCMALTRRALRWILPIPSNVDCYDRWIAQSCELFGTVTFVDEILIHHRMHEDNVTPKTQRSLRTILKSRIALASALIARKRSIRRLH